MRCLALAQAWKAHGGRAAFLSHGASDSLRRRVEGADFPLVALENTHPHTLDLQVTLSKLQGIAYLSSLRPWLVLDGYHFDSAYQGAVRAAGYPLLVVDDTAHLSSYHADVLLNQNLHAERLGYAHGPETVLLLGARYVLLRPEFLAWQGWRRDIPEVARRVLITLGGGDPHNLTVTVMKAVQRVNVPGLEAVVVIGAQNPHFKELQEQTRAGGNSVRLIRDTADMAEWMAWADVAVSAGGSTCWELAFMGLPTITMILAENQQSVAEELARAGAAVNLGWFRQLTAALITRELTDLCQDQKRRRRQSSAGRRLVDGGGAERVVAVIRSLGQPVFSEDLWHLRPATWEDRFSLWRLANDPTVRAHSFHPKPIPLDGHEEWFVAKLRSPYSRIWLLDVGGKVAAQVRYDRTEDDILEIDFSVDQAFRGKGIGTRLLSTTSGLACRQMGGRRLRGIVLRGNHPSKQAFIKAGFEPVNEIQRDGHRCLVFERECF